MDFPDVVFRIIRDRDCPLYEQGDELHLSQAVALQLPYGKAACLILVMDICEAMLDIETGASPMTDPSGAFNCSGCTGEIRVEYTKEADAASPAEKRADNVDSISSLLTNFSFFGTLDERHIDELVPLLKIKKYVQGEIVIEKGERGRNLFIILSGRVEVLGGDGIHMAFLEKGEVFGEMSLLSGDPVGATVKVTDPSTVLYLDSRDFRRVLNKFPSLQMYFAQLLARRLARANVERSQDFSTGMVGHLSEMSPSELFQALNVNQKSGVLSIKLPAGDAEVIFREGELIGASYGDQTDKTAFFIILQEKEGRFKFSPGLTEAQEAAPALGNFMWLLMEGARRQDEEGEPHDD